MAILQSQGQAPPPGDGPLLEDPGQAAATTFYQSLDPFSSASGSNDSGTSQLLKDLGILLVVGLFLFAFFEFGGIGETKKIAGKGSVWFWGVLAAIGIGAFLLWQEVQQTGSDFGTAVSNFTGRLNPANWFSSNASASGYDPNDPNS